MISTDSEEELRGSEHGGEIELDEDVLLGESENENTDRSTTEDVRLTSSFDSTIISLEQDMAPPQRLLSPSLTTVPTPSVRREARATPKAKHHEVREAVEASPPLSPSRHRRKNIPPKLGEALLEVDMRSRISQFLTAEKPDSSHRPSKSPAGRRASAVDERLMALP